MADDQIVIQIELDDGTVKKGFLNVEKQSDKTSKNIQKDFKKVEGGLSSATKVALGFVSAFAGLQAVRKTFQFLSQSIQAASKEQDAIQKLNTALALTGKFSQDASLSIQNFANELQKTTKFGNETTLEVAGLIQSLGKLDSNGLQKATKAALDLSTALGIDVNSAATLVGKAANGNVEAFGRYGIAIQKGKTQAETFANTLKALEQNFGGSAEAAANTFSGAITKLNNNFGDFQESIGNVVIQSPSVVKAISLISDAFALLSDKIKQAVGGEDLFKPLITSAIDFVGSLDFLIRGAATLIGNTFLGALSLVASALNGIIGIAIEGVERLVSLVAPNSALAKSLKSFSADFLKTAESDFQVAGDLFKDAFTLESLGESAIFFQDLKAQIEGATLASQDLKNNINPLPDEKFNEVKTALELFKAEINGVENIVVGFGMEISDVFKRNATNVLQGFAGAAGNAFATFGKSIAKGKASLADFGKAFLAAIGNTAVQLGTSFILEGTAYLFSANPALSAKGAPLIAAGAALATFGGVLSGIGGGGGTASAASAGAGGSPIGEPGIGSEVPAIEEQRPTTQVAVNISGDVLDSRDTGLRIVDLIKEYTDRNGRTEVLA